VGVIEDIRLKAVAAAKTIILPESDDARTMEALEYILDHGIAKIILIAKENIVSKIKSRNLKNLKIVDPEKCEELNEITAEYYELRKPKGMTAEEAAKAMREDYLTFGAMMVRRGMADGFVAGANHTTADTVRAALRCLKIDKTLGVVSGAFLMVVPNSPYGEGGAFIFADCGVNPEPNARQLSGIAVSNAACSIS
jgi:phosphate acetyltransferase